MPIQILHEMSKKTLIMGILNCTPDSFSDGGMFLNSEAALGHARKLIEDGADILDIGGESSRPGAAPVSLDEERNRVIPVIKKVRKESTNICISVDTTKAQVAREALDVGADMINDISALNHDPKMGPIVAAARCPVVLMHMKGTPKTFVESAQYEDVVEEVIQFLRERIEFAESIGIKHERIIIDPGLGFGKKPQHNSEILKRLQEFSVLDKPILLGTSRKSYLGADTTRPVEERLEETLASSVIGVLNGAKIIRAHDIRPLREALKVAYGLR